MIQIRVIVIGDDSPRRDEIVRTVRAEPDLQLAGTSETEHQTLAAIRNAEPDIVLVDEMIGAHSSISLIARLTAEFPHLTLVAVTEAEHLDYLRQAMFAGARGFVTLPLDRDELVDVLQQAYQSKPDRPVPPTPQAAVPNGKPPRTGHVVVVYSPKGGVGKTTVATNLAIALRQQTEHNVAVVDTDPQFGHVGLALNAQSSYSILDLATNTDTLDSDFVDGMMPRHASGVNVLLAPPEIERPDAIPPGQMAEILLRLRGVFDWVVVDTWTTLTDCTVEILDTADMVLLIVTPDLTVLRDAQRFIQIAKSLRLDDKRFKVVVTRANNGHVDHDTIEESLAREIFAAIPDDEPAVTHCLNRGVPLIMSQRRNPVSRAIAELARQVAATYVSLDQPGPLGKLWQKLPFGGD